MLTPNDSSSFENQLSPRQDLTFNSLQALFDQQGLPFSPPSSQFGSLAPLTGLLWRQLAK